MEANVIYDKEFLNDQWYPSEGSAGYQPLKTGYAVCSNYASLLTDFCYLADIPCYKVTSCSLNHAYNVIKLKGYWYIVDPQVAGFNKIPKSANPTDKSAFYKAISNYGKNNLYLGGIICINDTSNRLVSGLDPQCKKLIDSNCQPIGVSQNAFNNTINEDWRQAMIAASKTVTLAREKTLKQLVEKYPEDYSVYINSFRFQIKSHSKTGWI